MRYKPRTKDSWQQGKIEEAHWTTGSSPWFEVRHWNYWYTLWYKRARILDVRVHKSKRTGWNYELTYQYSAPSSRPRDREWTDITPEYARAIFTDPQLAILEELL